LEFFCKLGTAGTAGAMGCHYLRQQADFASADEALSLEFFFKLGTAGTAGAMDYYCFYGLLPLFF
jgi:hypothetical protein